MEIETLLSVDGHGVKGNGQERDGRGGGRRLPGQGLEESGRPATEKEGRGEGLVKTGGKRQESLGKLLCDEDGSGKMYDRKRRRDEAEGQNIQ